MCAYKRKTWQEKMNNGRDPEVVVADKKIADIEAGKKLLIPTPFLVDQYIRQITKGETASVSQMRSDLAMEHHADATCPLTTGIFLRIVAEAAYEEYTKGRPLKTITPFWRVINETMPVAKKLTCGLAWLNEQRRKEKIGQKPGKSLHRSAELS